MTKFEAELNDIVSRFVVELATLARNAAYAQLAEAVGRVQDADKRAAHRSAPQLGSMPDAFRAGLAPAVDAFQRACILRALEEHAGNISKAAQALRTNRPGLQRRMKRLQIGVNESSRATRSAR